MTAPELKPCPFCGQRAETQEYGTRTEVWAVWCVECRSQMESLSTEAEAIAAWNTRADTATWNAAIRAAAEVCTRISTDPLTKAGGDHAPWMKAAAEDCARYVIALLKEEPK